MSVNKSSEQEALSEAPSEADIAFIESIGGGIHSTPKAILVGGFAFLALIVLILPLHAAAVLFWQMPIVVAISLVLRSKEDGRKLRRHSFFAFLASIPVAFYGCLTTFNGKFIY